MVALVGQSFLVEHIDLLVDVHLISTSWDSHAYDASKPGTSAKEHQDGQEWRQEGKRGKAMR